jgi:uncharacterized protein
MTAELPPDRNGSPDAIEDAEPVEVPWEAISPEALRGLVESFVLREGTDYGDREVSHDTKVEQVQRQLRRGEVVILFDPMSESVTLVNRHDKR